MRVAQRTIPRLEHRAVNRSNTPRYLISWSESDAENLGVLMRAQREATVGEIKAARNFA